VRRFNHVKAAFEMEFFERKEDGVWQLLDLPC
jgi:hypothetical protein